MTERKGKFALKYLQRRRKYSQATNPNVPLFTCGHEQIGASFVSFIRLWFLPPLDISQVGIECFPPTLSYTRPEMIGKKKVHFESVFRLHDNGKPACSNSSGLKSVFKKLNSRDRLTQKYFTSSTCLQYMCCSSNVPTCTYLLLS